MIDWESVTILSVAPLLSLAILHATAAAISSGVNELSILHSGLSVISISSMGSVFHVSVVLTMTTLQELLLLVFVQKMLSMFDEVSVYDPSVDIEYFQVQLALIFNNFVESLKAWIVNNS